MKDTGGPAFPTDNARQNESPSYHFEGMTLRDYFAAKAMPAYFSDGEGYSHKDAAADWAYEMADAMLKAREA